jgi:hypothetical protein
MADNVSKSLNGDIMPGDLVLSGPDSDYPYLVGTVLGIDKVGSADHDTDNLGDDVHVNFMSNDYSERRMGEIDKGLAEMYGDPLRTLNSYPLDDVIMAPEMLIRIDGIHTKDYYAILDSLDKAAAYFGNVLANLSAERAVTKPTFERLVDKLGAELGEYHAELLTKSKENIIGEAYIAASMSDAFFSLTEELELTDAQITVLLEADSPLQDVAEALRDSHNQDMCMLDAGTILEAAHIEVPDEPDEPAESVPQPRTVREWIERGREEMKNRQPSPKPEHKKRDAEL